MNVIGVRKRFATERIAKAWATASGYAEESAAAPEPDMDTSSDEEEGNAVPMYGGSDWIGSAKNGIVDGSDESGGDNVPPQKIYKRLLAPVSSDSDSSHSD